MDNQQPSSEQEKVQRLSRERVGREVEAVGIRKDEDIVCALRKRKDVLMYKQSVANLMLNKTDFYGSRWGLGIVLAGNKNSGIGRYEMQ